MVGVLKRKIRVYRALTPEGRSMAREAFVLPLLVGVALRTIGVVKTQQWLRQWSGTVKPAQHPAPTLANARLVYRAAQNTLDKYSTCLTRSLAMWATLRRHGIESELRLGMKREDGKIKGHAWLEYQGHPINDSPRAIAEYSPYADPVAFDRLQGR